MQTHDLATNEAMNIFKKSSSMSQLSTSHPTSQLSSPRSTSQLSSPQPTAQLSSPRPMSHVPPQPVVTSNTPFQPPHGMPSSLRSQENHRNTNGQQSQVPYTDQQYNHRRVSRISYILNIQETIGIT